MILFFSYEVSRNFLYHDGLQCEKLIKFFFTIIVGNYLF
jgi:hypothetical protein